MKTLAQAQLPEASRDYLTSASRPEFSVLSTKKFEEPFKLEVPDWIDGILRVVKLCSLNKKELTIMKSRFNLASSVHLLIVPSMGDL